MPEIKTPMFEIGYRTAMQEIANFAISKREVGVYVELMKYLEEKIKEKV